jgi:protoporphyrinogen/coproporphyrinogen III oxidase
MQRVAIVGGGISGLSAAYALEQRRRRGAALEYAVFESANRFGGSLRTEHVDDCVVEAGPDSFLTEKPWAADLCRELGLAGELIGSNDSERKTYILVKGRLVPIPDGLMFMVPTRLLPVAFTPLFSWGTKLRMAREWFHPPRKSSGDESVAALVERHYGPEMVERLADPLLSGVYGGDAAQLSVRAVLRRFSDMEAQYGSLGRAMLAARKKMPQAAGAKPPLFTSLKDGMQQLVDAMLAVLPSAWMHSGCAVSELRREGSGWAVSGACVEDGKFDGVIVATSAPVAGALLRGVSGALADELQSIGYSSSVTATLIYRKADLAGLPPGFGFLVPRAEGRRMLACTFVHNKFPHRAPADRGIIRCFLGGSHDEEILDAADDAILALVRQELKQILGLDAQPRIEQVYKWKAAMAQYAVGHLERLERIEGLREELSGLALAGNGYTGIGVPDCVRSGMLAADQTLAAMGVGVGGARQVAQR